MSIKKKKVKTGYKYKMGVQLGICHGPVDKVSEVIIGEKSAWTGAVTANSTFSINQPKLFGGDGREGGCVGNVDVMMGATTQQPNAYLQAKQGALSPGYIGILSLVFKSFQWSSNNPYFKSPWIRVTRILNGWGRGAAWNPTKATIDTYDINPAHIIYQCLTDPNWGMGYNTSDIDEVTFGEAADSLFNEGFGLSIQWSEQSSINDFIKNILDHISGVLRLDLKTGKFVLKLIRDDYVLGDLVNLNPSNVIEFKSFQRATYGDFANEIVVSYLDRDENERSIAVQDLASIRIQGAVISSSRNYPGIRTADLAARVAQRDLNSTAMPLAKVSLTTNRILWDKEIGDVVSLTWPEPNLGTAAYRIVNINKGTLVNGEIAVELVEDIFGLSDRSYAAGGESLWTDTLMAPAPVQAAVAFEIPYWELIISTSTADFNAFQPGFAFGYVLACRGNSAPAYEFSVNAAASAGGTYTKVSEGQFCPTGTLTNDLGLTDTVIQLSSYYDLDQALYEDSYAYIENEIVALTAVNADTGSVTIRRGCLDTVPTKHATGVRVYFVPPVAGVDSTERVSSETVYYKPTPSNGMGELPLSSATAIALTMQNRATRPYPPGKFQINGQYEQVEVIDTLTLTWVSRNRLQQTVDLVDTTQGSITTEPGVTYNLRIYNTFDESLLLNMTGLTVLTYTPTLPVGDYNIRIELESQRDGLTSLQKHVATLRYIKPLAYRIAEDGNYRITEDGKYRIVE